MAEINYEFRKRYAVVHKPGRRDESKKCPRGFVEVDSEWCVTVPTDADVVMMNAARDLIDYFFVSMNISLQLVYENDSKKYTKKIVYGIDSSLEDHSYRFAVEKNKITLCGKDGRAAAQAGYVAQTASKNGSDIIHKTIVNNIYNSELILADLTEHNPNVLFELGLAIAFKKRVAIIRAKGTTAIFGVDNSMRVLDYSPNLWKSTLEMDVEKLAQHIDATATLDDISYLDIFLG